MAQEQAAEAEHAGLTHILKHFTGFPSRFHRLLTLWSLAEGRSGSLREASGLSRQSRRAGAGTRQQGFRRAPHQISDGILD